jgi:hypothetical protein
MARWTPQTSALLLPASLVTTQCLRFSFMVSRSLLVSPSEAIVDGRSNVSGRPIKLAGARRPALDENVLRHADTVCHIRKNGREHQERSCHHW